MAETYYSDPPPDHLATRWTYEDRRHLGKIPGLLTGILLVAVITLIVLVVLGVTAGKAVDELWQRLDKVENTIALTPGNPAPPNPET